MIKAFKLTLDGKALVNLTAEGDDDLVNNFVKETLTDTFGAFYKAREAFTDLIIEKIDTTKNTPPSNTVRVVAQIVERSDDWGETNYIGLKFGSRENVIWVHKDEVVGE